jgi:carbon monoxide dehydrogenase subunit G
MREDVVRDDESTRLELLPREPEQLLVVVLLCVEEDDVEHVVDCRQELECVALAQLGPLLEARLLDVASPRFRLRRVVLERQDAAGELTNSCAEPDRGVAAGTAELEHLTIGLRRDEREEETACRHLDLTSALLGRKAALALGGILTLEAVEHGTDTVVEHAVEPILRVVRAELTIEIARTPDDVFAYLTDVSNLPAWQAGVKSATLRAGRIEESRSLLGRELHTTFEIVEREEPRLFTLRALDSPIPFTVRHQLEPTGNATRLTVTAEGDVPGLAAGLLARRAEKQFRKDFARLKQILES